MMADVKANGLDLDEGTFAVDFVLGGDYPWMASALGLGGHTCTYPCLWCEVHKKDLGKWRAQLIDAPGFAPARTPSRLSIRRPSVGSGCLTY